VISVISVIVYVTFTSGAFASKKRNDYITISFFDGDIVEEKQAKINLYISRHK